MRSVAGSRAAAAASAGLLLAAAACTPPSVAPADTPRGLTAGDYAQALFDGTNAVRAEQDLPPFEEDECARAQALDRAEALVGAAELEHAPLEPVVEACDPANVAAENLSRSATAPADVLEAWWESPGHRSNIVDPELGQLGVACAPTDEGEMLCSQIFLGVVGDEAPTQG
ncbi:CAP domain-containing protein [Oerskovia flava]|uniref:CAP domain-containing protein n=1 Tax=Oerskovia flava TaxID=2986422 RepID=UPI00223F2A9A|nr:CAP domain-containing protein [Oerskovia sp. JB1-3-2]